MDRTELHAMLESLINRREQDKLNQTPTGQEAQRAATQEAQQFRVGFWTFVADVGGELIPADLHSRALELAEIDHAKIKDKKEWEEAGRRYQVALLARLLLDIVGMNENSKSGPTLFREPFNAGAIVADLLQMLKPNGSRPQILITQSDNVEFLKSQIRKQFVLGVYYRAAKEKCNLQSILDVIVPKEFPRSTWGDWAAEVSAEEKNRAKELGKSGMSMPNSDDTQLRLYYDHGYGKALP